MKDFKERAALVGALVEALDTHGSWCGETHIQKAGFFLQEMGKVPLEYDYILYKHGPFSFELRDELTAMRAYGFLEFEIQPYPYGPRIILTTQGKRVIERSSLTAKYQDTINFIALHMANKGVAVLERLGTALYVTNEIPTGTPEERSMKVHELKPHVTLEQALVSISEVDRMITECTERGCNTVPA